MDDKAIRDLKNKVLAGDVTSMRVLADIYYKYGNSKDLSIRKQIHEKAKYYFELASEKGDIYSRLNLAHMILLDFYIFVGMNLTEKTSDIFFKLKGSPKKIIKGLELMFSIIDGKNVNQDLYQSNKIVDTIIEKAAFFVHFISIDFLYIRNFLDRGKFLDPIKNQIEEYGKKSEQMIEKYKNTAYFEQMFQQYRENIVIWID